MLLPDEGVNSARVPLLLVRSVSEPIVFDPRATVHLDCEADVKSGGAANNAVALAASNKQLATYLIDFDRLFLTLDLDVVEVNRLEGVSNSRQGEFADDDL